MAGGTHPHHGHPSAVLAMSLSDLLCKGLQCGWLERGGGGVGGGGGGEVGLSRGVLAMRSNGGGGLVGGVVHVHQLPRYGDHHAVLPPL